MGVSARFCDVFPMTVDGTVPVSPVAAVARLRRHVDVMMPYRLGSGGYTSRSVGQSALMRYNVDELDYPWSADRSGVVGSDCAGAICYAYALVRHRPGFNKFAYDRFDILDVEDDLNTNSMIGDATHGQELFVKVPPGRPLQVGDVLAYPTIMLTVTTGVAPMQHTDWLRDDDGNPRKWIGHCQLVKEPRAMLSGGPYTNAQVIQCYGPNDRRPAIRVTDAHVMDAHDDRWPLPEHRTQVLRLHPRYVV